MAESELSRMSGAPSIRAGAAASVDPITLEVVCEGLIAIVREMLNQHPRVMKEPAPIVGVTMLSDSSIDIAVKPWTSVADYGLVGAELYKAIVERFRERNISMPFPQREVRLLGE